MLTFAWRRAISDSIMLISSQKPFKAHSFHLQNETKYRQLLTYSLE
jgi:hypothetical protein